MLSLLLFQIYKLSRENSQPENMCIIVFEKTKGRGGIVNRVSFHAEAAVQRLFNPIQYGGVQKSPLPDFPL